MNGDTCQSVTDMPSDLYTERLGARARESPVFQILIEICPTYVCGPPRPERNGKTLPSPVTRHGKCRRNIRKSHRAGPPDGSKLKRRHTH